MEDKSNQQKRLKALRSEILEIKKELNTLNTEKEKWFEKKESQKHEIADAITKIKSLKGSKDKISDEIKELKNERDKYNKEVQLLIKSYKDLLKKKKEFLDKSDMGEDPNQLMTQIENIEKKIETEVLPFKKEQTLMKQLKSLKNSLVKVAGIKEIIDSIRLISKKIAETKDKAQEYHNKLKTVFVNNKDSYSEFMELTKVITVLKKDQENSFNKFIEYKKKFAKVNESLKQKLLESKGIQEELGIIKKDRKGTRNKKIKEKLRKRTEEVEEKLKTGQKLTTEDLLIFQESNPKDVDD